MTNVFGSIDYTTCGKSKGCLFLPDGCDSQDITSCTFRLTYAYNAGEKPDVQFEMDAKQPDTAITSYVAVGFNNKQAMARAIFACNFS